MQSAQRSNVATKASDLYASKDSHDASLYRASMPKTFEECWDELSLEGKDACVDCEPFDEIDLEAGNEIPVTVSKVSKGTNQPHPALEFLPAYHVLKRSSWCLDRSRILYALRWRASYPLQRRVPFSRWLLRMLGSLTWGELLLLYTPAVVYLAQLLYYTWFRSVAGTGIVARQALYAVVLLAPRNSLITFLIGIPVDRCMKYHKISACAGLGASVVHCVVCCLDPKYRGFWTGQVIIAGIVMMFAIIGIFATAAPWVRRNYHEVFLWSHRTLSFTVVVGAFFHSGTRVPSVSLVVFADYVLRTCLMDTPKRATLKVVSDTVVEVSFPKTESFDYNPGQYAFLRVPEITWLQSHPFSISSAPCQDVVTFHIRKAGDWTDALLKLAKKKSEVEIVVQGPHGSLEVDIMGDRKYKSVLLISGGIGITPMNSISEQLLLEQRSGQRELRNLKFIWIERDPFLVEEVSFLKDKQIYCNKERDAVIDAMANGSEGILSTLLSSLPPGVTSDAELEELYGDGELEMDGSSVTTTDGPTPTRCDICLPLDDVVHENETSKDTPPEKALLDIQVYLTGNAKSSQQIPFARLGRPDINALFEEMRRDAIASGDRKVAVCVCAPHAIMRKCRDACISYSDETVRFDLHCETMGF